MNNSSDPTPLKETVSIINPWPRGWDTGSSSIYLSSNRISSRCGQVRIFEDIGTKKAKYMDLPNNKMRSTFKSGADAGR
jgi:hypothetical protein